MQACRERFRYVRFLRAAPCVAVIALSRSYFLSISAEREGQSIERWSARERERGEGGGGGREWERRVSPERSTDVGRREIIDEYQPHRAIQADNASNE